MTIAVKIEKIVIPSRLSPRRDRLKAWKFFDMKDVDDGYKFPIKDMEKHKEMAYYANTCIRKGKFSEKEMRMGNFDGDTAWSVIRFDSIRGAVRRRS
jgi:hypothetical protein